MTNCFGEPKFDSVVEQFLARLDLPHGQTPDYTKGLTSKKGRKKEKTNQSIAKETAKFIHIHIVKVFNA